MQRICPLLAWLLFMGTGCGSTAMPPPKAPPTPQTIRLEGLYRAVESRGTTEKGEKIYKLIFLRFLENGTVHVATAHGIFDAEEKTREVATEGFLSDARLNDQGSQGPWTLDVNKLKIILKWKFRGRWEDHNGEKVFAFDQQGELVEFSETHSGTVDGDTLKMNLTNETFNSYVEYTATFVPLPFSKTAQKEQQVNPAGVH